MNAKDEAVTQALETATAICLEKGLRLTTLRRRVLELIWEFKKPVGAYTVLARLGEDGRNVAPPTVYRALDFLLEHGFVHRLASMNAFIGSQSPGHKSPSQFLICSECLNVVELKSQAVNNAIEESAANHSFEIKEQMIEISGVCGNCK